MNKPIGFFRKIYLTLKTIKNSQSVFLDFCGFLNGKEIVYRTRSGSQIIARGGSTDISEIIVINADQEYPKKFFPKIDYPVIVDIGANIGTFSIYINEKLINNNPCIYSVEPSLNNFNLLVKNIKINDFSIRCFNIAISDHNGEEFLDISSNFDAFKLSDHPTNQYEIVSVQTLESFCSTQKINFIDLLKVDIEGGEYKVFHQSIDFIKTKVKAIFIEVHHLDNLENNLKVFKKYLISHNFQIEAEIRNSTLFLLNRNLIKNNG